MKTHVIQLGPQDDLISVRDQMTWAKTSRIILVFPPRSHLLGRDLDLRLLKRHARKLGAKLALVGRQKDITRSALELHIPVFSTVKEAQLAVWEIYEEKGSELPKTSHHDLSEFQRPQITGENKWGANKSIRLTIFTVSVGAILILVLLFVPSSVITLTPETNLQTSSIAVSASPSTLDVYLTGSLPARQVTMQVQGTMTVEVTGSVNVPDASSTGVIQFRNLSSGMVEIPTGTIIGTMGSSPIRFKTTQDAIISGEIGATVDVPIIALEPGSAGNLPPDSLVSIEGELGASLAATNPDATQSGTNQTAMIQTADDRARLRLALEDELLDNCGDILPPLIDPGDMAFPATLAVAQVLSESYFPPDGQPGGTLTLNLSLQCRETYISISDLEKLATMVLDANLPDGYKPVSAGITIPEPDHYEVSDDGSIIWTMKVQRLIQANIGFFNAAVLVIGKTRNEASGRLADAFDLIKPPDISMSPPWWPWLPVLPIQIHFSIVSP